MAAWNEQNINHVDRVLNDKLMKRLLIKGETPILGFRSRNGRGFQARLKLNQNGKVKIGKRSLREIEEFLAQYGLHFGMK